VEDNQGSRSSGRSRPRVWPTRGRARGRHTRGLRSVSEPPPNIRILPEVRFLEPGVESPAFPPMLACPVAVGESTVREPVVHESVVYEPVVYEPVVHESVVRESVMAGPVAAGQPGRARSTAGLTLVPSWPAPDSSPSPLDSLLVSAERFITLFYTENKLGSPDRRLWHIRQQIEATGTYWHTPAELTFGARVAWRNSSRCIGRLYWHSLRVRDCREISAASGIAAEAANHLREATNDGKIRPVITVFAPDHPHRPGPRIISSQLIRYAGYQNADGTVTGDPANVELTRLAVDLGWRGGRPAGRFDLLPLLVQEPGGPVTMHELPTDTILEVLIKHPEFPWFAELGLRWHAVPAITDMYLEVGGVCYPAAPFNGWYMCTEIGSRNLGDTGRYAQLPVIAEKMGLSIASDRNLWKDRALTELNVAVLHSYTAAGVTMADHHTESGRFLQHMAREEKHGRACPADWTWIVPPAASSATPVFHRYYQDFDQTPNFYRHPAFTVPKTVSHDDDLSERAGKVAALCRAWAAGRRQTVSVHSDVSETSPEPGNVQRTPPFSVVAG
jgi:nitric-oxide synthase, bacterial